MGRGRLEDSERDLQQGMGAEGRKEEEVRSLRLDLGERSSLSVVYCNFSSLPGLPMRMMHSVASVEEQYLSCASLRHHVKKAREISDSRNELRTTMAQLDQIFTVPETVEEVTAKIGEDDINLLKLHHQ